MMSGIQPYHIIRLEELGLLEFAESMVGYFKEETIEDFVKLACSTKIPYEESV